MTDAELIARLRIKGQQPYEMPNHHVRRMEVERIEAADRLTQQQQVLQWISEHGDGEARRRARAALARGQKEGK